MLTRTLDNEEIIERVAALGIGKAELMCCVRVPDEGHPGRRMQEVQAWCRPGAGGATGGAALVR